MVIMFLDVIFNDIVIKDIFGTYTKLMQLTFFANF